MSDGLKFELTLSTTKAGKQAQKFVGDLQKKLQGVPLEFDTRAGVQGLRNIKKEASAAERSVTRLFGLMERNAQAVNNELEEECDLLERMIGLRKQDLNAQVASAKKGQKALDETDARIKRNTKSQAAHNKVVEDGYKKQEEFRRQQIERAKTQYHQDSQRFGAGAAANVSGAYANSAAYDSANEQKRKKQERDEKTALDKRYKAIDDFLHRRNVLQVQYGQRDEELEKRHQMIISDIEQNGSRRRLIDIQRQLQIENVMYAKSLQKKAQTKQQGSLFGTSISNKTMQGVFQGQQMIEDFAFAGWRGASNNIAMLASSLGGPGGLIALLGVTALTIPSVIEQFQGMEESSESLAIKGIDRLVERLETAHDRLEEFRALMGSSIPTSIEDWQSKALGLNEDTRRYNAKFDATQKMEADLAGLYSSYNQAMQPGLLQDKQRAEALKRQIDLMEERLQIRREEAELERKMLDARASRLPAERKAAEGYDAANTRYDSFRDSMPQLSENASSVKAVREQYEKLSGGLANKMRDLKFGVAQSLLDDPNNIEAIMEQFNKDVEEAIAQEEKLLSTEAQRLNVLGEISYQNDQMINDYEDAIKHEESLIESIKKRIEALHRAKEENQTSFQGKMFDMERGIARKQGGEALDRYTEQNRSGLERDLAINNALGGPSQLKSYRADMINNFYEQRQKEAEAFIEKQVQQREAAIQAQHEKMLRDRANMFGAGNDLEGQLDALKELQSLQMQQASQAQTSGQMLGSKKAAEETQKQIQDIYDKMEQKEVESKDKAERNLANLKDGLLELESMKTEINNIDMINDRDPLKLQDMEMRLKTIKDILSSIKGDPLAGVVAGGMPVAGVGVPSGGSTSNVTNNQVSNTTNYNVSVAGMPQRPSLTMREAANFAAKQAAMRTGIA